MWSGTSYIIFLLGERETNIIDLKKKKKKKKLNYKKKIFLNFKNKIKIY